MTCPDHDTNPWEVIGLKHSPRTDDLFRGVNKIVLMNLIRFGCFEDCPSMPHSRQLYGLTFDRKTQYTLRPDEGTALHTACAACTLSVLGG